LTSSLTLVLVVSEAVGIGSIGTIAVTSVSVSIVAIVIIVISVVTVVIITIVTIVGFDISIAIAIHRGSTGLLNRNAASEPGGLSTFYKADTPCVARSASTG